MTDSTTASQIKEVHNVATGYTSLSTNRFTFIIQGWDSKSVDVYSNKGTLPQLVASHPATIQHDSIYVVWENLNEMVERMATTESKN